MNDAGLHVKLTAALRSESISISDDDFNNLLALLESNNKLSETRIARALSATTARAAGQTKVQLAHRLASPLAAIERNSPPAIRVLIVTALPLEFSAVRRPLVNVSKSYADAGTLVTSGKHPDLDGTEVHVIQTGVGNAVAAQATTAAIAQVKPNITLFVGIAGGLKNLSLGDVVAASFVYELGHVAEASETFSREKSIPGAQLLVQIARDIATRNDRLRVGPIVGGDVLLKSLNGPTAAWMKKHQNDALAIEMEGWGFAWSSHAAGMASLVIRGVSDDVTGKNAASDEKWQPAAAIAAAMVAYEVLDIARTLRTDT